MNDATPLPSGECTPDPGYRVCVSDSQLQSELKAFLAGNHLPVDLGHLYPLFLPREVQAAFDADLKSGAHFCAYHFFAKTSSGTLVYAVEPYGSLCPSGQVPNGDQAADTQVDTLSHEILGATTDPAAPKAWLDSAGVNETPTCAAGCTGCR